MPLSIIVGILIGLLIVGVLVLWANWDERLSPTWARLTGLTLTIVSLGGVVGALFA